MTYEWRNIVDGEIVEHDHWSTPPSRSGIWRRVYSVHFLPVNGAGGSPGGYVRHVPKEQHGTR